MASRQFKAVLVTLMFSALGMFSACVMYRDSCHVACQTSENKTNAPAYLATGLSVFVTSVEIIEERDDDLVPAQTVRELHDHLTNLLVEEARKAYGEAGISLLFAIDGEKSADYPGYLPVTLRLVRSIGPPQTVFPALLTLCIFPCIGTDRYVLQTEINNGQAWPSFVYSKATLIVSIGLPSLLFMPFTESMPEGEHQVFYDLHRDAIAGLRAQGRATQEGRR